MSEENQKRVAALVGMFATHSPLSAVAQRAVLRECDAGHALAVREALAYALLEAGIVAKRIPANAGDLALVDTEQIKHACVQEAIQYRSQGGVLLARDRCTTWELAVEMYRQWESSFSPPIEVTRQLLAGMSEQEISDRICVAALVSRDVFLKHSVPIVGLGGESSYCVAKKDLETLLVELLRQALATFDNPNAANHALIHS